MRFPTLTALLAVFALMLPGAAVAQSSGDPEWPKGLFSVGLATPVESAGSLERRLSQHGYSDCQVIGGGTGLDRNAIKCFRPDDRRKYLLVEWVESAHFPNNVITFIRVGDYSKLPLTKSSPLGETMIQFFGRAPDTTGWSKLQWHERGASAREARWFAAAVTEPRRNDEDFYSAKFEFWSPWLEELADDTIREMRQGEENRRRLEDAGIDVDALMEGAENRQE